MSKKLILCALVLTIAAAAPALAEAPDADVAAVLGIAAETCDAPVEVVEPEEPQPMAGIVFEPVNQQCGTRVCTKGFFCCNLSCSICAPVGGGCTQQVC